MPVAGDLEVRAELGKVLASPLFVHSPRMTRFLRFVVETTLAGGGQRIKEYVVATEVFEKPVDYDPQIDSTVRTEATKLRSRLNRYYETEGNEDPIIITIPKGSYVPQFEIRNCPVITPPIPIAPTAAPILRWIKASAILAGLAAAVLWWISRPSPRPAPASLIPLTSYPDLEEQPSLSPDGSQVAFRWRGDIYVKPVGAEAMVRLTVDPGQDSWPSWSPDGTQIAFVRDGSVFLVSPLGGPERRVAESVGPVAWLPDGSRLLVLQKTSSFGAQSIYGVSLASGLKERLTFPEDISIGDVAMAVSPDGKALAFCRAETGPCDLFSMAAGGGEPRRLTNDLRRILGLAWTADGREIVFASDRRGRFQLWRVSATATGPIGQHQTPMLVEGTGDDARYPSISRTSRLAYQRYSPNLDVKQVEIVGSAGTATHRLGRSVPVIASTQMDAMPSWSPDGNAIAFISERSGNYELWVCHADGSKPLKLTSFAGPGVFFPRWSRDGQRLVFTALTGPGANFEGYIISAKGGAPQRVTVDGHRTMAFPVFSRDGGSIYFIPGAHDGNVDALRAPSSGGQAVQITRHGAFRLDESPNGALLYYGKSGTNGIWSTPVSGGEERQVLNSVSGMNWTVVSDGIYYFELTAEPGDPTPVKFYSFKSSEVTVLGTVEAAVPTHSGISVSPDGRRLLYTYIASATSDLMMLEKLR